MYKKTKIMLDNRNENLSVAYMEFVNSLRHLRNYQCICFVEGYDDRKFYRNSLYKKLGYPKLEIFYQDCGSKNDVTIVYKKIENSKVSYNKDLYYIVDLDYNGHPHNVNDSSFITLPCYSFENFYFYDENIKKLFETIIKGDVEKEIIKFCHVFNQYIEYILLYSAFKKVIVSYGVFTKSDEIKEKLTDVKILDNNINFRYNYDLDNLKEMIEDTSFSVTNESLQENIEYLRNNRKFIIGKLLFKFFLIYLNDYLKIKIDKKELLELSGCLALSF